MGEEMVFYYVINKYNNENLYFSVLLILFITRIELMRLNVNGDG